LRRKTRCQVWLGNVKGLARLNLDAVEARALKIHEEKEQRKKVFEL